MNEELINSAISFLKDPQVADSPLTKKVEFLESKGLNQQEIEEALKRANDNDSSTNVSTPSTTRTNSTYQSSPQGPPIDYYNVPPPLPERSWKDYFIMATATAGVTYGLYQVVSRYLIPSIIPPSQSSIEKDKETINEEFIKIDKILEQLTTEQEEIKAANEAKLTEIGTVIDNVNDFLSKYNKDKLKFDDDLRLMKLEIENLSNSVEKNMNLTKENINDELGEVSQELQSLKNLIKARSGTTNTNNGTADARKIAPVSSIPSASEILKRARAKNSPEPAKQEVVPQPEKKTETETETESRKPERVGDTKEGNVFAAGIPAWQLQHKQQEELQESTPKEEPANQNGIPAWQQSAVADATKAEEEIKEKIKNVGVPSWQLNATTPSNDTN
ncbi:PEX14 Peroxisomal membrane protein PEX14 [Candida maltosa Xu316]|uniref:Peroxisomal membrane protein PEX14 n=1 Tax=Candida maltosa (strain Xu316) TaxID=1245528 RepID=M3JZR9_CANMX|nr:hypothetical protein G210_0911 [Candida maltosa Xu316]